MGSGDITKEYDKLDRILAELGEIRIIINAFGNEQAAMKTDIASIKTDLAAVKTDLAAVKTDLASVNSRLDSVEGRLASLESRVDSLEEKFDRKLQETKPLWVDQLQSEMEKGFRLLSFRMDKLAADLSRGQAYQQDFEERISRLEDNRV